MSVARILGIAMAVFVASQIYWYVRARALLNRVAKTRRARMLLTAAGLAGYLAVVLLNFGVFGRRSSPTRMTWYDALVSAPFEWWVVSSLVASLLAILMWPVRRAARSTGALGSPGRRQFLERTAGAVVAAPFLAGAYGLLYGRLNLQIAEQRIRLARLPQAFAGFRIAQLSDIHIGPFMPEDEIRKYVRITNDLKPDLIALTGDFVTWDPSTQRAVVNALTALRAPFGIFGCLGNHEAWSHTEDSITRMFQQVGIRILRQERVPITTRAQSFNLIGVDFETRRPMVSGSEKFVQRYLDGVDSLVAPDTVNILMSHNPNTFDRAAELGIDLSLAGHTHGGQVALEFISPELAPSRLVTPYVAGWFQKPGGQLYVNRGIGTIGVPMRIGAPPEITVYELVS
ncbi:MAG TPA: metallophosphoesterase [Bryobacteraceae bacterium]|jgi:predicted MPP superfamily phosphohydrolase|nr:metallophosphoesterase [Bryobacteraceae bacterium]